MKINKISTETHTDISLDADDRVVAHSDDHNALLGFRTAHAKSPSETHTVWLQMDEAKLRLIQWVVTRALADQQADRDAFDAIRLKVARVKGEG